MNKIYCFLLLAIPLKNFSQSNDAFNRIWNRDLLMYQQGKKDSINISVARFNNFSEVINPVQQFCVTADSLVYKDGYMAAGRSILDSSYSYNRRRVGVWTYYYPSGKKYAQGEYSIGAWTMCQVGGPNAVGYDYKSGNWNYWYENGNPMATGIYDPVREGFKTSCSSDTMFKSGVTLQWTFYDPSGNKQTFQSELADKINQGH